MERKPNIAIVIRALSIGGAEKQSILAAKYLQEDFTVHYFIQKNTPREPQLLNLLHKSGITYIQLNGNIFSRMLQLHKAIGQKNIRVVFAYLTSDNLLVSMTRLFKRHFVAVGGIRNSQLPWHKFLLTKILQRFCLDYIIFNNYSGCKSFIEKGFSPSKCITIPNCFNLDSSSDFQKEKNNVFTIITVGRFVPQKDYVTALLAFKQLQDRNPLQNFKYIIVGYGPLVGLINSTIATYHIHNVSIIKKPADIGLYYKMADVYLCSSLFEGISNTLLEAMSYSLPIIATNVGDNPYLVHTNINGFLVATGDTDSIAKHLMFLSKNPDISLKMGEAGFNILQDEYSPGTFIKNYKKMINQIL